jgi:hypothetical protein
MNQVKYLAPVIWLIAALSLAGDAQVNIDLGPHATSGRGYLEQWDSVQNRLILYRDSINPGEPAVLLVNSSGNITEIYPLKDLTGAQGVTIWSVAGTPNGGVAMAAVARYGPPNVKHVPLKSLLLTYDEVGTLRKLWELYPYEPHYIVADSDGNIFGLGEKDTNAKDYPLLVKYSPDGEVVGQFLSAKMFPQGDTVLNAGSATGESEMFIKKGILNIWVAPQKELLQLSLSGELRSRISLADVLQRLQKAVNSERFRVEQLGIDAGDQIVLQIAAWDNSKSKEAKFGFAKVSTDGTQAEFIRPLTSAVTTGKFLGTTSDGKVVFRSPPGKDGKQAVITIN